MAAPFCSEKRPCAEGSVGSSCAITHLHVSRDFPACNPPTHVRQNFWPEERRCGDRSIQGPWNPATCEHSPSLAVAPGEGHLADSDICYRRLTRREQTPDQAPGWFQQLDQPRGARLGLGMFPVGQMASGLGLFPSRWGMCIYSPQRGSPHQNHPGTPLQRADPWVLPRPAYLAWGWGPRLVWSLASA